MDEIRSMPCLACPYRRDVPSGLWAQSEYDKLRQYDRPTADQPFAVFACHATPEHLCHGWAHCHSNRGGEFAGDHPFDLLALRIRGIPSPGPSPVPLFSNGNEAADWGTYDIEDPSPEAVETIARLLAKYPRLEFK